jgi:hypothetical protein
LAEDEDGPYWTYRHPTVGDAFASFVGKSPELVELYLRGAKPDTIVGEVVCAGVEVRGASVVVPTALNDLLVERIASIGTVWLISFICFRSNATVTRKLIEQRPDLRKRISSFSSPLRDDLDVDFIIALHRYGLLSEKERLVFVEAVRRAAVQDADDSFIEVDGIRELLTPQEYEDILLEARDEWLSNIPEYVERMRLDWDSEYSPEDYFDRFERAVANFTNALAGQLNEQAIKSTLELSVKGAIREMRSMYEESPSLSPPIQQSPAKRDSLEELFRDVDD